MRLELLLQSITKNVLLLSLKTHVTDAFLMVEKGAVLVVVVGGLFVTNQKEKTVNL